MQRRIGFTLIELLVVVAIIALLVTILMPSLNRAKEMARQAVCSSTLRTWGTVSHQFAGEHDGMMPSAFHDDTQGRGVLVEYVRMGEEHLPNGMPAGYPLSAGGPWKSWVDAGSRDGFWDEFERVPDRGGKEAWRAFGTSWDTFLEHGLAPGHWRCPASPREPDFNTNKQAVGMDYMFVGHLGMYSPFDNGREVAGGCWNAGADNYGYLWLLDDAVPPAASHYADEAPAETVLAADRIRRYKKAAGKTEWNHDGQDPALPGWQGIVWGDGHVAPRPDGYHKYLPDPGTYSIYAGGAATYTWWCP